MNQKRKCLIGSMYGEKIMVILPLLKWYVQHGLKVTKIHQVVEYTPATCFQKFGDNISDARLIYYCIVQRNFTHLIRGERDSGRNDPDSFSPNFEVNFQHLSFSTSLHVFVCFWYLPGIKIHSWFVARKYIFSLIRKINHSAFRN
jgi:hypothetical protein